MHRITKVIDRVLFGVSPIIFYLSVYGYVQSLRLQDDLVGRFSWFYTPILIFSFVMLIIFGFAITFSRFESKALIQVSSKVGKFIKSIYILSFIFFIGTLIFLVLCRKNNILIIDNKELVTNLYIFSYGIFMSTFTFLYNLLGLTFVYPKCFLFFYRAY